MVDWWCRLRGRRWRPRQNRYLTRSLVWARAVVLRISSLPVALVVTVVERQEERCIE